MTSGPNDPTDEKVTPHETLHLPLRSWCSMCVLHRAAQTIHTGDDRPRELMNFMRISSSLRDAETVTSSLPITALVMLDRASGDMISTVIDKDVVVHTSQVLRANLWEDVHVTMRHDTNLQRQTLFKNVRGICASCKPPVRWSHRESQPRSCVPGSRLETICHVLHKQHDWHSNLGPVDQLPDCFTPHSSLRRWRRRTRQWNPFEINRWNSRSPAAVSGHSRR